MGWTRRAALVVVGVLGFFPAVGLQAQEEPAADTEALLRSSVKIKVCFGLPADAGPGTIDLGDFGLCREGGSGSGTVLEADGTVLTNAHVALGPDGAPAWLLVGETVDPRDLPRWAYIGRASVYDAAVDLAIVEPVYALDGSELAEGDVQLRPLEMAAAPNDVGIDDPLWMIGYPGVGGAYVSRISVQVVGFDADGANAELNPGWIKVSPAPAPGNSGGTTVDAEGRLVAVPTSGGGGDIRCLDQDNDGHVDPSTECISMTSDIGRVRPLPEGYDLMMTRANAGDQGSDPAPEEEAVVVVGSFVSADTGEPVADAYFAVLQSGVDWDEYRERSRNGEQEETLLTYGWSDDRGQFQLNDPVPTGQDFTIVYGGAGYEIGHNDGFRIEPGTTSPHELEPIELAAGR